MNPRTPLRLHRLTLAAAISCAALSSLAATTAASGGNTPNPGFFRQPTLQGENLVFVAEGDLWRVNAQGGRAERLSTHVGQEGSPVLSRDGRWLAYTAQYDGPGDVYLMPVQGGLPQRLSWEGNAGQRVWGFSALGEVIYSGPSQSGQPVTQLYAVDPVTQARRALPVAQASDGAISSDGRQLFFTRNGLRGDNARQYRGGALARLWTLDLTGTAEARPLVTEGANDRLPMPYRTAAGERIAFLSDRDGTVNLWSVNAQGQDLRQHTTHKGWDIRHASVDGGVAVYALGADLYRVDLNANTTSAAPTPIAIQLSGDFEQQRQRWVKKPQDFLTSVALAPNGERVLLASRGRLATQGLGQLRRAELPQAPDSRCLKGLFSADSKQVLALCDFSGEREVWRFAANGLGKPEQITRDARAQRKDMALSPDGRYLAHTDKEGHLYLSDLKGNSGRLITRDSRNASIANLTWSPDSRSLAFTQALSDINRDQLQLFNLADNKIHTVSSERYDSDSPAFSPDGRWLYFVSNRQFTATGRGSPWGDRNMGPYFDRGSKLFALALQPGLRFPFAPKDELEPPEPKPELKPELKPEQRADAAKVDGKAEPSKAEVKPEAKPEAKPKPPIHFAGLRERLFELPLPAGNYSGLTTDGKRLWFLDAEINGGERKSVLKTAAIDNQGGNIETVASDVRSIELSADGKKMLVVRNGAPGAAPELILGDAGPKLPAELAKFQVRWSDWQIATDPRAEWRQMFADGWRMHRDYFYDKAMHGVDWPAMRAKYEPLVERVSDRAELAELMAQMIGELGALHSQVNAGDQHQAPEEPGLAGLGAQLARTAEGLRIERIYRADPELPSELGPLARAELGLKDGDLITHINGRKANEVAHEVELLRGQAGKQVLLQIKPANGGPELQRIVTPVARQREQQLRYADWRFGRAQAVEKASNGRIGYVHLRAMGPADIADFAREFYTHVDREGLIIDVRFNGGGSIDSWILEKLLRRAWAYWQPRSPGGAPVRSNMQQTFRGQVVVLQNEHTYSDGETFAEGFKRLGLGPLIGTTTSGAGVWLSDQNRLMDNGIMRAAETGQIAPDGRFLVEGIGVKPDLEVDNLPRASFMGADAQLDAAIATLNKAMAEKPRAEPKPGAYPRPVSLK